MSRVGVLMVLVCLPALAACDNPMTRYKHKSMTAEASLTTRKMADGAKIYFESEQSSSSSWHGGAATGEPIPFDQYTFPGGASFSMTTHDAAPKDGTSAKLTLDSADAKVAPVLGAMFMSFGPESFFRYTYTTGAGTGTGATLTIKAEADFDPSTPAMHTETYELKIDEATQDVVVTGPTVTNELQ